MKPVRTGHLVALALVGVLGSSCAIGNEERRRVLNYLDANWAPSSEGGRWLASPVALPVGLLAGVADAVVVHPLSQIDDAWGDTVEFLWEFDRDDQFRNVLMTPLSAVATPVVFGVDWLGRAIFDIDDRYPAGDGDGPEAGR
ncbi:MAG TPA: hypothetical protein ENI87_09545 [bacterium]|nr:hypothetical protein [bacterium]